MAFTHDVNRDRIQLVNRGDGMVVATITEDDFESAIVLRPDAMVELRDWLDNVLNGGFEIGSSTPHSPALAAYRG